MSGVAWPNQTPIGTASNFLQCAMCINVVDSSQEVFVVLSTQELRIGKKTFIPLRAESVAGFVGAPSAPSVVSVPSCAVLPSAAPSCEMVRDGADGEHSDTTALCDRNVSFQPARTFPLSAGVSRPYLPSAPNKATETVIFCFGKMFARAAAAGGSNSSRRQQQQQKQQQQEAAAAGGGSSSSRRKQQQQQEAVATGGSSSSNSSRKQQQEEEAAAAGGSSSSSSNRRKQQHGPKTMKLFNY